MTSSRSLKSLEGRDLGLGPAGNLVGAGGSLPITPACVDATITVGAESTNVRAITIQLKDQFGNDIESKQVVQAFVFADASGNAFASTGGSTGIAIGTDGALLALVAKKAFILISEDDGDIDLTWTDTGTEAAYLGLLLPNGRLVMSAALTNA